MRDLVVAGGGPVGLATALYAARAGLDVVVRERRPGPVDKACGEGLMPGAVAALRELGVQLDGHAIDGIRYLTDAQAARARFRDGPGRGVRRTRLQAALVQALDAAGVEVEHRQVGVVQNRGDHVLVDGEPVRYLVAADGLHSPLRRAVGLEGRAASRKRFGQRCHVAVPAWSSYVDVHWNAGSEAYVTPVAPDLVGVAVLSDRRGTSFDDLLRTFPHLQDRIGGVEHTRVLGAGPLRQRARGAVAGRVLLVGDASGYVDALTGEGIALGLAQARAAVDALRRGDPSRYARSWRHLGRRHELLTRGLLSASHVPAVRARLVPTAARFPGVFSAAVNQLARPL